MFIIIKKSYFQFLDVSETLQETKISQTLKNMWKKTAVHFHNQMQFQMICDPSICAVIQKWKVCVFVMKD